MKHRKKIKTAVKAVKKEIKHWRSGKTYHPSKPAYPGHNPKRD